MKLLLTLLLLCPLFLSAQTITISCTSAPVCAGVNEQFKAVAAGVAAPHYYWKRNTIHAGADTSVFTTNALATGDSLQCLLTNSAGDTVFASSNIINIIVYSQPYAGVISGADTVCLNATILLLDTTVAGLWSCSNTNASVSGGIVTGKKVQPSFDYLVFGTTDTIYYLVSNSCGIDTASKKVFINPLPSASFFLGMPNSLSILCVGGTLSVNAGSGYVGNFYSQNGNVAGNYNGVYGVHAGNDVLIGVHTNYCGTDTYKLDMKVYDLPHEGTIIAQKNNICPGDSIQFIDTTYIGSIQWSTNNGNALIANDKGLIKAISTGNTIISVNVSNICGLVSTSTLLTINPPVPITSTGKVCVGAVASLSDSSGGGVWRVSNDAIATIDTRTGVIHGVSAGIDTVFYELPTGCSTSITINVNPKPKPIAGDNIYCSDTRFVLSDSGGNWSIDSNYYSSVMSQNNGTFLARSKGPATIKYINKFGCYDSLNVNIINCDQYALVFPNPVKNECVIEVDTILYSYFRVTDIMDKELIKAPITGTLTKFSTALLPKGLYILYIYGYNGLLYTTKLIKL